MGNLHSVEDGTVNSSAHHWLPYPRFSKFCALRAPDVLRISPYFYERRPPASGRLQSGYLRSWEVEGSRMVWRLTWRVTSGLLPNPQGKLLGLLPAGGSNRHMRDYRRRDGLRIVFRMETNVNPDSGIRRLLEAYLGSQSRLMDYPRSQTSCF
jgi:hypothetical protein